MILSYYLHHPLCNNAQAPLLECKLLCALLMYHCIRSTCLSWYAYCPCACPADTLTAHVFVLLIYLPPMCLSCWYTYYPCACPADISTAHVLVLLIHLLPTCLSCWYTYCPRAYLADTLTTHALVLLIHLLPMCLSSLAGQPQFPHSNFRLQ